MGLQDSTIAIKYLEILECGKEKNWRYKAVAGPWQSGTFVLAPGDIRYLDSDTALQKEISCLLFPGKFITQCAVLVCLVFSVTTSEVVIVECTLLRVIYGAHLPLVYMGKLGMGELGSCFGL